MRVTAIVHLVFLIGLSVCNAQTQSHPTLPEPYSEDLGTDATYANVFVGPSFTARDLTKPSFTAGVTLGPYFARTLGKGFFPSPQFELGVVGPLPGGHPLDGLVSINEMFAAKIPHHDLYPFLTGGYTRVFATGHAVNFGAGIDIGKEYKRIIRIEVRDYYLLTGPKQHVFGLRIGFGFFGD
jgi:hypothetical protein